MKKKERDNMFELVLARSKGLCEYCGNKGKEFHHVFGGRWRRLACESFETVVYLCQECHRGKDSGTVIKNLKIRVCKELIERYGEEEARRKAGGRLYFEEVKMKWEMISEKGLELRDAVQKEDFEKILENSKDIFTEIKSRLRSLNLDKMEIQNIEENFIENLERLAEQVGKVLKGELDTSEVEDFDGENEEELIDFLLENLYDLCDYSTGFNSKLCWLKI